jgi:hypothetical protein
MVELDLLHLSINGYQDLACAKKDFRGQVCVLNVKNGHHFIKIDTLRYCKEQ